MLMSKLIHIEHPKYKHVYMPYILNENKSFYYPKNKPDKWFGFEIESLQPIPVECIELKLVNYVEKYSVSVIMDNYLYEHILHKGMYIFNPSNIYKEIFLKYFVNLYDIYHFKTIDRYIFTEGEFHKKHVFYPETKNIIWDGVLTIPPHYKKLN